MATDAVTETCTVLVTDLVESTALRSRLGEDAAEALRRDHDRLLAGAVSNAGGVVVKNLGDGVLARFAGASDALAAAVAIQQQATVYAAAHPDAPLSVRVGVSAGDVSLEDGDCFGTPVIEASRLCATATGGQILAAELVRMLARGRGGYEFRVLGECELKGMPAPVIVDEVAWEPVRIPSQREGPEPLPTGAVPLPFELESTGRFQYAGRVAAREALRDAWKRSLSCRRQVVLIAGEPGIGKTRLAAEVARSAFADGAVVLFGRADDTLDRAYQVLAEPISHLVRHLPEEIVEAHRRAHGFALAPFVPDMIGNSRGTEIAEPDRAALFDAVVDIIARAAALAPVVVVLDDLHWGDPSSLYLLRHVVRATGSLPFTVLGTYRDTDLARTHPLATVLADLRREPDVERVALSGLEQDEIAQLMALAAGGELSEAAVALATTICEQTGGNPFFIGEILVHLAELGVFYLRDGRWTTDEQTAAAVQLPEGVREVIGRRLSELSESSNDALRAASVLGHEFDAAVVAAMTGLELDAVIEAFELPLRRGILIEAVGVDRFRFAHPLTLQTLYEELSTSRRVRMHARAFQAMSASGRTPVEQLAHQAIAAAGVVDAAQALQLALDAAEEARQRTAYEQAAAWCRRALELDDLLDSDPLRRGRVLLALSAARNDAGEPADARLDVLAAADCARAADDATMLAEAATLYGGWLGSWLDYDDTRGIDLADEALARLPSDEYALRARVLLNRATWMLFAPNGDERRHATSEAVRLARSAGDHHLLCASLLGQAEALRGTGETDPLRSVAEQLREAGADQRRETAGQASYLDARAAAYEGDVAALAAAARECANLYERYRQPLQGWHAATMAVSLRAFRGDVAGAHDALQRSEKYWSAIGATGSFVAGVQRVWLLELEDRYDELVPAVQAVVDNHPVWGRWILGYDAWLAKMSGDRAAASTLADGIVARLDQLPESTREITLQCVAWGLSDVLTLDAAARLYDRLLPRRGTWIGTPEINYGSASAGLARLAARLGNTVTARELWEEAIETHRAAGEIGDQAMFRREYARWRQSSASTGASR